MVAETLHRFTTRQPHSYQEIPMSIQTFFKSLISISSSRRPIRRRASRLRLRLEALEDRLAPSFSPAVDYIVGYNPAAVLTGDFTNDGQLDLALANPAGGTVSVLKGNADGTFRPAVTSNAGGGPVSLAAGDFNGDGKLDLATANNTSVTLLLGNGDGTFRAPATVDTGTWTDPVSVAAGDFN